MNRFKLSSRATIGCLASALFVGCGGLPAEHLIALTPLRSDAETSAFANRAIGGAFKAHYAGTYETQCGAGTCITYYNGTGKGTFVHYSLLTGKLFSNPLSGCGGGFTFQSETHPTDALAVTVTFSQADCQGIGNYTVSGGDGKFSHASGSGTVSFSYGNPGYVFTSSWNGTLRF